MLAFLLLVLLISASCQVSGEPAPVPPQRLATLLASLPPGPGAPGSQALDAELGAASPRDPNWPVLAFLTGEAHLAAKEVEKARTVFRRLAVWAVSAPPGGPYRDGWGGSALGAIALWRWLQILDAHGAAPDEIEQALAVAASLQSTRLFAGMVRPGLLPALPLVEEDVARLRAHVAWKARRPEATALFLDFVSIASTAEFDALDAAIEKQMLDDGLATRERLDLFRSRRQLSLVTTDRRKQQAADRLRQLWADEKTPADVRAEAGYEWSNFYRRSKERKGDVVSVLSAAFDLAGGRGLVASPFRAWSPTWPVSSPTCWRPSARTAS